MIKTASQLAHAINHELTLGLTPLPWNLYAPEDSLWWLAPSTENPAYRHGKYVFASPRDWKGFRLLKRGLLEDQELFAGFGVEKGYGKNAVVANPALKHRPQQIMPKRDSPHEPKWAWYDVIQREASEFGAALAAASRNVSFWVCIGSSSVHDREDRKRPELYTLVFSVKGTQLRNESDASVKVGVLEAASKANDFAALAHAVDAIDEFHWVDVYVGTCVATGSMNVKELYTRALFPFRQWLA
jgi:hypothetical protein